MCGIVGFASARPTAERIDLALARDTMAHRGPDDAGCWWSEDGRVGLASRRLAIIDLSPGGHQPKRDGTGHLTVVFNGELYNFRELRAELAATGRRFETASDTEVLLEAYGAFGDGFLARLNGMFAFALHDARRGTLLLVRDRAGEKPLFYRQHGGTLAFASELKALLTLPAVPRSIDLDALDHFLAYGYAPAEGSILRGIRKLPPAHALLWGVRQGAGRVFRYWSLPEPQERSGGDDPEALLDELDPLLLDAVRLRLIADVPVGVLLSGGVDSGLVAAMAARASPTRVRTFTVSLPGQGAFDEGPAARRVAEALGTEHTEVRAEPAAVDLLAVLARQYDEPIADPSMVPTALVSRAIRAHCTVALGGDGGDELFGGYGHYRLIEWQRRARRWLPAPARELAASLARHLPAGTAGRNHLLGLGGGLGDAVAHVNLYFDRTLRRRLLVPRPPGHGAWPEERRAALAPAHLSALQAATRADFLTTLPEAFLVKLDRASMLASLEVRAPMLDHRVVEFAFSRLPDALRVDGRRLKVLARRLARRLLPPGVETAPKRGFTIPLDEWMRGPWWAYVREVLAGADPSLLHPGTIQELLAGQRAGRRNGNRLFALTMLELWRREYGARL